MSPDGALNPGNPAVVASAYANSALSAVRPTATTLFDIDATADQLLVQNPPNAGTLGDGKPLGVNVGDTARVGLKAGTRRLAVRVTDESGARTRGTLAMRVGR